MITTHNRSRRAFAAKLIAAGAAVTVSTEFTGEPGGLLAVPVEASADGGMTPAFKAFFASLPVEQQEVIVLFAVNLADDAPGEVVPEWGKFPPPEFHTPAQRAIATPRVQHADGAGA
jgi:hypothetical protein